MDTARGEISAAAAVRLRTRRTRPSAEITTFDQLDDFDFLGPKRYDPPASLVDRRMTDAGYCDWIAPC
jgi:hypothetical protein